MFLMFFRIWTSTKHVQQKRVRKDWQISILKISDLGQSLMLKIATVSRSQHTRNEMQFCVIIKSWKGNTANPKNRENGK